MRSRRSILAIASYTSVLVLCTLLTCVQVARITRHLVTRQQKEPVPAFGEADVVYFFAPTCPACKVTSPTIGRLRRQYPQYRIARVDTATPAGIALQEEYSQAYKLPAREQGRIPIAFAGRRHFLGITEITRELPAYLRVAAPGSRLLAPGEEKRRAGSREPGALRGDSIAFGRRRF